MAATHYLSRQLNLGGARLAGCSTIAQNRALLSTWYEPSVTCKTCRRNAVWDPEGNERRAAQQRDTWATQERQRAARQEARHRAASAVLARHRRAFLAAYEAELTLLTLAAERPTVHSIRWPTP